MPGLLAWVANCSALKRVASFVLIAGISATVLVSADAHAAGRHALLIGVGDYGKDSGLGRLKAPANDADQINEVLRSKGFDFTTRVLKDQDAKDKSTFEVKLQEFLSKIESGDEVLFYFSGHGLNVAGKGNFYLLPDSRNPREFLKSSPIAGEKPDLAKARYEDWIADKAISENAVLKSISERKPRVIIIVADACRNSVAAADMKSSASPIAAGVILPKNPPKGTYFFYSAREGQSSLDAIDSQQEVKTEGSDKDNKNTKKSDSKKVNSLFTSVLLRYIDTPLLEINYLATQVKLAVRDEASKFGESQVPDFSDDSDATDFYFWQGDSKVDLQARCRTAPVEMQKLIEGVSNGAIAIAEVEKKRNELAPCGLAGAIDHLLGIQRQGGSELSTRTVPNASVAQQSNDPAQICDQLAASPMDANRAQGTGTVDIQKVALSALSPGGDRAGATAQIQRSIDVCEKAAKERSRVARLKFNLGRSYYAMAAVGTVIDRPQLLAKASSNIQEAADLGYTAAYNSLAQLYQNNDYYEIAESDGSKQLKRRSNDRERTAQLLRRGADLGDVLAQFNYGMAFKNGDLGLGIGKRLNEIRADAFQYLSRAAESGLVPAMIETAIFLDCGCGIVPDKKRAIQLLEIAASRGSWEAMFQLGQMFDRNENTRSEAILWYARAAEGGDTRSQARLAWLLTEGDGLPAPQREAAARYWRLAANGGSLVAQVKLADLLRKGEVPFRPNPKSTTRADGGAQEILELYSTAFARGYPGAGLELARLFRTGFPPGGSDSIPKNYERAIELLWKTMDRVRQADPGSLDASPEFAFQSAFELIKMYEAGEAKRADGSSLILEDQIDQLKTDYGDPTRMIYIRVAALGKIECSGLGEDFWVAIWDRKSSEPPTEEQFNWFERYHQCKLRRADDKRKDDELGITKKIRDLVKREFQASIKNKDKDSGESSGKAPKPFTDRMVELVNKKKGSRQSDNDE